MIASRHYLLTVLAPVVALLGSAAWAVSAQTQRPNTWTSVAPLPAGRVQPAAASANGRLYAIGGGGCYPPCNTVDAYDPTINTWTAVGTMPVPLGGSLSATTGPDGYIYIFGNQGDSSAPTVLVYDPRANTWTNEPPPPGIFDEAQLVTGRDGRIYAVGGRVKGAYPNVGTLSAFSLSTHTWTSLRPLPVPRDGAATAVGPDGRIYVIGGAASGEVDAYDVTTNTWSTVAPLPTPRGGLQAVTGPDGRIYTIGGSGKCFTNPCRVVEAYDVRTNTWTAVAPMPHGTVQFTAALGPDGRIYVLGGSIPNPLQTVDAYTVVPAGQSLPTPRPGPTSVAKVLASMATGREELAVVTGHDGRIYAIGGIRVTPPQVNPPGTGNTADNLDVLRTVEAYTVKTNRWTAIAPLPTPLWAAGAAVGPDGRIYVLGGTDSRDNTTDNPPTSLATVEIYNPKTRRWSRGHSMPDSRYYLAAVSGKDGRIYTIGGFSYCNAGDAAAGRLVPQGHPAAPPTHLAQDACYGANVVQAYNFKTDTWTQLASLPASQWLPVVAVGKDGRIYAFGDSDSAGGTAADVYDPRTNRWRPIAPMIHSRVMGFAAATGKDGRIYLIGGCVGPPGNHGASCGPPSPVDAYDPTHNTWTTIGATLNARQGLAATTGPDGRIYAVGGSGDGNGRMLEVLPLH